MGVQAKKDRAVKDERVKEKKGSQDRDPEVQEGKDSLSHGGGCGGV